MTRTDALTLAKKAGGSFDGSGWKLVCDFDEDDLTAYATEAERMGFLRGLDAWPKPSDLTPPMLDALRICSRRDWPSDELCRARYAALLAAIRRSMAATEAENG